ncbi:MAG: hypothetical protein Q4B70_18330, partial [Lachnospiraceae bacterium]|nr:hypothetical protein [Lachnospiraceae bacterium]
MIVYVASHMNANIFQHIQHTYVKIYVKWDYDLSDFIKEEYANLIAMQPEKIVMDEMAIKNQEALASFKELFPSEIIILKSKDNDRDYPCRTITLENKSKDDIVEEVFSNTKKQSIIKDTMIGIIGKDMDACFSFAFRLASAFHQETLDDICLIEVGTNSYVKNYQDEYELVREKDYFLYQGIPFIYNAALEKKIKVFLFTEESDRNVERWKRCDFPLRVNSNEIYFEQQTYSIDGIHQLICSGILKEEHDDMSEHDDMPKDKQNKITIKKETNVKKKIRTPKNKVLFENKKIFIPVFVLLISLAFVGVLIHTDSRKKELKKSLQEETKQTTVESVINQETTQEVTQEMTQEKTTKETEQTTHQVTSTIPKTRNATAGRRSTTSRSKTVKKKATT